MPNEPAFPAERELVLIRLIDAPRDKVYRCWTEPELLMQWFAPKPFTTAEARLDVRAWRRECRDRCRAPTD